MVACVQIIHHTKFCSLIFSQTLNKLFIINAGSGFRMVWKVIKTFLDARTMSKILVRTFLVNSFLGRGSLLLLVLLKIAVVTFTM